MSQTTLTRMTLTCTVDATRSLDIARVRVTEAISALYRIEVDGLTDVVALDLSAALGQVASLTVTLDTGGTRRFKGIVTETTDMGVAGGSRHWHRLVIMPALANLGLIVRSRCFITPGLAAPTVKGVLQAVVEKELPLAATRVDLTTLSGAYPDLGCALQVEESDLDFMSRTAEAAGIAWVFPPDREGDVVAFVDAAVNYKPLASPAVARNRTAVLSASLTRRMTAQSAMVTSWDPQNPATKLDCTAAGEQAAAPRISLYEQGFTTTAVGQALAAVRRDEAAALQAELAGESLVLPFAAGCVFDYTDVDAPKLAASYLLTEVVHEIWQSVTGSESLPSRGSGTEGYSNRFRAVPLANRFRPARRTRVPRIDGLLRATVCDSTGAVTSVATPFMDQQGRYQVLLPFPDADGALPSRLAAPLRLMAPFGGSQEGWHMPLRPGATVFLAFEGGNVDRPLIAGLLPNGDQKSPLPAKGNLAQTVIRTASGITMKMTDGGTIVLPAV